MPAKTVRTGHTTGRVCAVLKVARSRWVTAREVAERLDYRKPDYVRKLLNEMHDAAILDRRVKPTTIKGPHAIEYRVAAEWRSE